MNIKKMYSMFRLFIQENHLKQIFVIAIPVIIQNIVQHFQMIIDRAFLGNVDSRFLSVIGNVMVPFNAMGLFLVSVSTGLTILVAQNIGAGKPDKARDFAESSFVFATVMSSFIFIIWILFADFIFSILGVSSIIKSESIIYVQIISISMILTGVDITSAAILSGAGHTMPIMITGILKNLFNLILDYVFIFGKFGFPEMGLVGAGWATVISNGIGSVSLLIIALVTKKLPFKYNLKSLLRPKWEYFYKTMKLGLPSGFESLLWFIGQLALVRMINQINPLTIGILSLVQSINHLALFVYLGFARAAIALVGKNWGAGKYKTAKKLGLECQVLALIISVIWSVIIFIFPKELAGLFTKDPEIISSSVLILKLSVFFINFQVINVIMGHSIRGTGDTRWMMYSQIAGTVFVIIFSSIVIFGLSWGLAGVIFVLILDEGLRGSVNFFRFFRDAL